MSDTGWRSAAGSSTEATGKFSVWPTDIALFFKGFQPSWADSIGGFAVEWHAHCEVRLSLAREGGGIGRRTGFRFQRRKAWGFESLPSHQGPGFSGMQTSIEALSRLERRLNMAVPAEQIDREVEHRLRKLSRTVRLDGFRPGKVPLKIVAQHYGPQVRSEVIGDAVQKAFSEVVQEQKLKVAGYPRIERREGGDAKQLSFSATFEIYPEVKLGDLAAATIQRPAHAVDDADVERTLAILRKQRTGWERIPRRQGRGRGRGARRWPNAARVRVRHHGRQRRGTQDFSRGFPRRLPGQGSRGEDRKLRGDRA